MSIPSHDKKSEEVVKKRAHYLLAVYVVTAIMSIYVIVSLAGIMISSWEGHQTRNTLISCVEPHGKCFKEGQSRTGKAVRAIVEKYQLTENETRLVIIASIACSRIDGLDTVNEVSRCVEERTGLDLNIPEEKAHKGVQK